MADQLASSLRVSLSPFSKSSTPSSISSAHAAIGERKVPGVEDEHAVVEALLGERTGEAVLDGVLGVVAGEGVGVVPLVVELDADHEAGASHVRDLRVLVLQLQQQLRQLLPAGLH